ncbi:suppressor of rasval19, partial [Linderina pennispora]
MANANDLSVLLKRLERATARLEEMSAGRASQAKAAGSSNSGGLSADAGSDHPAVREYDSVIVPLAEEYVAYSSQIGDVVGTQAAAVQQLVSAQRNFVRVAVQTRKPSMEQLSSLLGPQQAAMTEAIAMKDQNRASGLFNHLSTVAEGIAAFGWVAVEPTPVPYINDMKDSAQFYANRVLKEWRDKDEVHAKWVRAFLSLLRELAVYVKQFHTTGVAWAPKGGDPEGAIQALSGEVAAPAAAPAPAPAAGGPPPPPPPPPVVSDFSDVQGSTSGAQQSRGALFAELSKGEGVTSGLRKVDKSEMTHKNPVLRGSGTVPEKAKPAPAAAAAKAAKPKGPARKELQGSKWIVENFGAEQVTIEATDMKQT